MRLLCRVTEFTLHDSVKSSAALLLLLCIKKSQLTWFGMLHTLQKRIGRSLQAPGIFLFTAQATPPFFNMWSRAVGSDGKKYSQEEAEMRVFCRVAEFALWDKVRSTRISENSLE